MIPASGGLITAVNWSMSNIPRFETEKVAPVYSFGLQPAVAGPLGQLLGLSADIGERLQFRVPDPGVMSPSSTATAIPICTSCQ